MDRVITIRPHMDLYNAGQLHGPIFVDESDGTIQPKFTFYAEEDMDLTKLPYFCKLYVSE